MMNFVTVGHIRDRARNHYKLPDAIHVHFLLPLEEINDEEMFSRQEFYRFLKPFIMTLAFTTNKG